jgi:ABC-type branched-subunit amino acid transport system substrate-binding protein
MIRVILKSLVLSATVASYLSVLPAKANDTLLKPRIGFTTSLTGDGAISGNEMKNAALLANEILAKNTFDIIFEDERCLGAPAAAAAMKLTTIDKIDYAMGFFCNVSLLTAAPIYVKAKVPLISTCATTMDTPEVGERVYRLFPADQQSIPVLYNHVATRARHVGILAEEDAYAQMLSREFERVNAAAAAPLKLTTEDYPFESVDFRALILRMKSKGIDTLFIDSATESTFIRIVRQMRELGFAPQIVGVYTPVSEIARKELGRLLEGAVAVTLPDFEARTKNPLGRELMREYVRRFGTPQSAFPVVLTTFEAMRLVALAHETRRPIQEVVRDPAIREQSLIGEYEFDRNGAVSRIEFELRVVKGGGVLKLPEMESER